MLKSIAIIIIEKLALIACILQDKSGFDLTSMLVFVAKIQKLNLIGCHLMLKSVNFFIFHFQKLNIRGSFEALLLVLSRGTLR